MSQGTPKGHTINHFTHNHPLTEVNVVGTYTCDGCKLYGEGKTYRCNECDYDLHEYCATCLPTLKHTWHAPDHELNMISGPAHMTDRVCYVCRVYIQGMFYKCKDCSFESHPHCTHGPTWSPHHYSQGNPYGSYPYGGGYHPHHQHEHQIQHPYMNMGSPKVDSKKDSSKGNKKKRGISSNWYHDNSIRSCHGGGRIYLP